MAQAGFWGIAYCGRCENLFMILKVIIGAATGALAGCGVGGGTLLLLYMTVIGNTQFGDAKWINLLFFTVTASIALISHIKNKLIDKKAAVICILSGVITAAVSAFFAGSLDEKMLSKCFGVLFIVAGVKELFAKKKE